MQNLHCLGVILISVVYYSGAQNVASTTQNVASTAQNVASTALNQFTLNLLSEINTQHDGVFRNKNIAIGPYTIWSALAILNEGAQENTAKELSDALGIPSDNRRLPFRDSQKFNVNNLKQNFDGIALDVANDIFIRKGAEINLDYKSIVKEIYNVEVQSLDFGNPSLAAQQINHRISNITHGYIRNIVQEDVVANANIILTSAMFFKGVWVKKFEKLPFLREFENGLGEVNKISQMYAGDEYFVGNILQERAQAVKIPYKGDRISMIVVVPKPDNSLSSVLKSLTRVPFKEVVDSLHKHPEVDITMPAFKISITWELRDTLGLLNIRDVFSNTANLSEISRQQLSVSSVRHRAEIDVNEEGTVAAAAAAIGVMPISIPSNIIVRVDRPFPFFIYDETTESILFTGIVKDPTLTS